MNSFDDGDVTDINYQRAMTEMQKMTDVRYLTYYWKAVGEWKSPDIPNIEKYNPWDKDLEHLVKR